MSNVFGGTPPVWVIDTASNTPVTKDPTEIHRIRWVAGTGSSAGGECKVTDGNTTTPLVIFDEFSTGAEFETVDMTFPKPFKVSGVTIPILASGKLYIYLR